MLTMRVPCVTLSYQSYNFVVDVNRNLFDSVEASATEVPLEVDARLIKQ